MRNGYSAHPKIPGANRQCAIIAEDQSKEMTWLPIPVGGVSLSAA
jgi:hypothetical protein